MPRRTIFLILLPIIVLISLYFFLSKPVNQNSTTPIEFEITSGQSLDSIAQNLKQARLIRSKEVFKITIFRLGLGRKIQAGFFYLSSSKSTPEIAKSLTKANAKQYWITIPEGLRRQEIANLIHDALSVDPANNQFDPELFIKLTADLEGRLFPDTYAFPINFTTEDVVEKLTATFNKVISSLAIPPGELDLVVILASLIEREAGGSNDKSEISGILKNRLNNRWPLQVDASVQFALASSRCRIRICDWWPKKLSKADLNIDSPFNTYRYPGLPPEPISNPGKESLQAAANPNQTANWFYLHDAQGQVHYAKTIEDHNRNICIYLKKDC
ncbi:endolytic transglycosylase MltG [Candidatus Collierbacteria bacterium]|nr:endolytic transglycosylase MltG [Candidatus Collierbacteria bacterium]